MRAALSVDCPAHEPHPVLLEQLTQLAAASVAPAAKPWWHRVSAKTGATVVVGALMISGATADAEQAVRIAPPQSVAASPRLVVPRQVSSVGPSPTQPRESADPDVAISRPLALPRHGRSHGHPHHARFEMNHQRGNADERGDGREVSERLVEAPRSQASFESSSNLPSGRDSHARARHRSTSRD